MACCFSDILMEKKPKPFDIRDLYQQFKIHTHQSGGFFAESITPDGIPPKLLRRKGWKVRSSTTFYDRLRLGEALGLDASLRALLPDFNFPIFRRRSASVAVGKWFCPFIFVREKARPKQQMKKSMFYTMTLEQKWEEIYSCGNVNSEDDVVIVDVDVQREVTFVAGKEAARDDRNGHNGFVWFKVHNPNSRGGELGVGLSSAIVENIRWVEEAGGWVNGAEREVRVERVEQITSESEWERFGCYVLVESFVLRRMDGGLVLKWDFRHTDRIQCKWECGF